MKKSFIIAAAAVLSIAAACTQEKDPFQVAIENAIAEQYGEGAKVRIEVCERVDSTTFGQELEYRQKAFDVRLSQNQVLLAKYRDQNKQISAQKKREAILHDNEVIAGLAQMEETLGEKLNDIAYYDYRFSGRVKLNGAERQFVDYYATVTPECEVFNFGGQLKAVRRVMGQILPGYLELVKGDDGEEATDQE